MVKWTLVQELISNSLVQGFPGGQLLVEKSGEVLFDHSFGSTVLTKCSKEDGVLKVDRGEAITSDTLFDIASLTKIFAVTYLFQVYAAKMPAIVEKRVGELLQETTQFKGMVIPEEVANIPIKALLSHHAGFEPNPLFYDPAYSKELYCQSREQFARYLVKAPLIHSPQTIGLYSDVDFMLLTFILEAIGGKSLEQLLQEIFWAPLGLTKIMYQPLEKGIPLSQIAATERQGNTRDGLYHYPNIRSKMIHGEVQDEKAFYCLEGISGHAGLFSNAQTLLSLFRLMYQPNLFFNQQVLDQFLTPHYLDQTFGLGWRLNGEDMRYMFGDYASRYAFGHTGWTGCLITHDPLYELTIIYLTNRKNTPVVNPLENPRLFYGDQLPAGKYLNIIHAIYQDLGI
ncbi:serine hydrolase [Ignatzschineria rhizosphaerae]|uniref:Serine hydrolase n=1 Tax=Ignatzschineria rhizosphaerae TaxID=2923279 RepID=A0ABY3X557_9GAMM|nr:serine hydrolase [Ignatzschineria rhizosphaerae]UNM95133.1 serine hydrolase [Ignatzschineria rhizosphaerae]